jgi:2-polyprenyl-6-methoxyphenol hydroxylase-like FAD-dependent oxidoreductase
VRDLANDANHVAQDGAVDRRGQPAAVLVVGAGPTGLLLASELQRRGVPCHLIDAMPGPLPWDRATVVHPRSLQIFESLGLAGRFLDAGCRQRAIRIHSNGKLLGTMDLSTCGSLYGFNVGMSEEVTESILTEYLHQQGGKVNRSSRLVGLTPHAEGALAEIEHDGDRYQMKVPWVVGCDGIHSPTRELSGIGFEGHDFAKQWAVFDATLQGWTDTFEATFVYFGTHPTIFTAIPGRRWRVYLRPSSEEADLVAEAASVLPVYAPAASFIDVENPRRFRGHTRLATRYRSGAVFLAGDAAHLCSPGQGHGMNCGLQDAFNLAWKLALVYHGSAEPALLDSYEAERRPAADLVARSGDDFEDALTMTDPTECDHRDQAIQAMIADPKGRHHEIVAETELNIDYSRSPIVSADLSSYLAPGQRLPDSISVHGPDGRPSRLDELAHRSGHTLMLLAAPAADGPGFLELHAALLDLVSNSALFEEVIALGPHLDLPAQIGELDPVAIGLLGVEGNTLLAVRPDGYIGLRSDRDHLTALERYCNLVRVGHF